MTPWAVVGALALACSPMTACAGDGDSPADPAPDAAAARDDFAEAVPAPALEAVTWTELGLVPIDALGQSPWVEAAFEADRRFVAIRVTPAAPGHEGSACYGLEPVELASGPVWVEESLLQEPGSVCTACSQRVSSGHGFGLFAFPNDGYPLAGADTLRFRVQMRDCALGIRATASLGVDLPGEVRVAIADAPAVPSEAQGTLRVRIAIAPGGGLDGAELAESPTWAAAWQTAVAAFGGAGVRLELERSYALAGTSASTLRYGPAGRDAMDALGAEAIAALSDGPADTRFVPVVLVPCLEWVDPVSGSARPAAGQTTGIPGMVVPGATASGVFLATGACPDALGEPSPPPWSDGPHLGVILAHELGHYLGLYHSDMPSGRHRALGAAWGLMVSTVLALSPDEATLTAAQVDVVRRHPDVVFATRRPSEAP